MPFILMSVRPVFANMLLEGSKTVELRRTRARIEAGSICLLYSSTPVRALVGAMRVARIDTLAPSTIWRKWGANSGLQRSEFNDYFAGSPTATALVIDKVEPFPHAVSLEELRGRWPNFFPPQSYRFLDDRQISTLLNGEASLVHGLRRRPS